MTGMRMVVGCTINGLEKVKKQDEGLLGKRLRRKKRGDIFWRIT